MSFRPGEGASQRTRVRARRARASRSAASRQVVATLVAATLIAATLALAGCGKGSSAAARSVDTGASARLTVRDDFGNEVALAPVPRRIVSLNPTTTELLFALGAGERLVGRSRWDEWPVAARSVPAVGDAIHPAVEQVLAARPDLVLLYASPDNRPAYDRLRGAGIRVVALRIDHIAQFERAARLLGRCVGDPTAGDSVADSVATTLDRVRRATRGLAHPTVVWPVSDSPPIVIGGGSYMSELLDVAGAVNLYGGTRAPSPVVSVEDVVIRDPDVVIRGGDDLPSRAWSRTWTAVPAVRDGRVVQLPTDLVSRPSVQLGAAAVALARALHPDATIP